MTIFEAINEFIKEKHYNTITIKKSSHDIDKYLVVFDGENGEFTKAGENIIDTIINVIKKAGISSDVTVTRSNELILKKLAELLDAYGPFLEFNAFACDFFGDYHLDFSIYDGFGDAYGKIPCDDLRDDREEQDIEEAFLESICSARAELEVEYQKTSLYRIAKYIEYENSRSEYNNAVIIIKREFERYWNSYSVIVRTNSLLGADPENVFESYKDHDDLSCVINNILHLIFEKDEKIREYVGEYCDREAEWYINELDSKLYDGVKRILDDYEDEHIILRISQNLEYQTAESKFYPKYFFKVQFKNTSENEILAESYNRNVRTALFDAVKEMMKKYQISF